MNKFKKLSLVGLVTFSVALVGLTACGKKDETKTTAESEETESSVEGESDVDLSEDEAKIAALDPVRPKNLGKIELCEWRGLELSVDAAKEITDEDVNDYLENSILPQYTVSVTDRAAEEGDTVNIDYVGTKDGEEFDGGSSTGYDLKLGSGSFVPGFEEGLVGVKAGDKVTLPITFPDDYSATELAGQAVEFAVTVNEVKRARTIDDLDDDLVKEISTNHYNTVDEYKAALKDAMQQSENNQQKNSLYNSAIEQILAGSTVEPSDEAYDWQIDINLQYMDQNLQKTYGMNLASYINTYGKTYDEFRADMKESGAETVKGALAELTIADELKIKYNDKLLDEFIKDFGYDKEEIQDTITPAELEMAVVTNEVCKRIIDEAHVSYNMNSTEE